MVQHHTPWVRGAFCDDLAKGTRMLSPTYNTELPTTDKPHWELGINCREEANFIHIGGRASWRRKGGWGRCNKWLIPKPPSQPVDLNLEDIYILDITYWYWLVLGLVLRLLLVFVQQVADTKASQPVDLNLEKITFWNPGSNLWIWTKNLNFEKYFQEWGLYSSSVFFLYSPRQH